MPLHLSPRTPRRIARAIVQAPVIFWRRCLFPALGVACALFNFWLVCAFAAGADTYAAVVR
jgi:hypothetical protein